MTFNADQAHALIERAIDRLKDSGLRIGEKYHDAFYRMACVGMMSAYLELDRAVPPKLTMAITSGRPLSTKTWQEVLAE